MEGNGFHGFPWAICVLLEGFEGVVSWGDAQNGSPSIQLENQNVSIFSPGQYVALVFKPRKTMDALSLVLDVLGPGSALQSCGQHPKG